MYTHPIEHPVVKEMIAAGLVFEVHADHLLIPTGFSKAGGCRLVVDKNPDEWEANSAPLLAEMRYNKVVKIRFLDDIIDLSWTWWRDYADRGYECPENFKQFFLNKGWIKIETIEKVVAVAA